MVQTRFSVRAAIVILSLLITAGCLSDSGEKNQSRTQPKQFESSVLVPVESRLGYTLDSVLVEKRKSLGIPGLSAAMVFSGNRVWRGAVGNSADSVPMLVNMLLGVGSLTKTYVAALAFVYRDQGMISLEDTIGRWLPPRGHVNPSITIRQLLNHTSGIHNYMAHPGFIPALFAYPDTVWTPESLLESFLLEPVASPGDLWEYSAANYVLLGRIVERLSGRPVSEELRERILTPLGLVNTYLYPDEKYAPERMAHLWYVVDTTGIPVDVTSLVPPPPLTGLFSAVWTAGAMHATAEDAAVWMKALFETELLTDTSLREMCTPTPLSGAAQYGLGIMADTLDGHLGWGHSGGIGYSSVAYYLPDDSLSIAVLGNADCTLRSVAEELYRCSARSALD